MENIKPATLKKIILVTGGAGFIGSHLCEKLLSLNYLVLLLDKFKNSGNIMIKLANIANIKNNSNLTLLDIDLKNKELLDQIYRKYKISSIVHLAGKTGVSESIINPLLTVKETIISTALLFDCAIHSGVKAIVCASSGLVYGLTNRLPMKEVDPCFCPTSPYAIAVRTTELLAYSFFHTYKVPFTGLRFFPVIGPRMRRNLFLPMIVRNISRGLPVILYGDGLTVRGYVFINDVVEGIVRSISKPDGYQLINLGGEIPLSLLDLIKIVENILGMKAEIIYKSQRKEEIPRLYSDIGKAKEILNWTPKISIEEGIKNYINWYKLGENSFKIS